MADSTSVVLTFTNDDYEAFSRAAGAKGSFTRKVLLIVCIVFLLFLAYRAFANPELNGVVIVIGMGVVFGFLALLAWFLRKITARHFIRKNPHLLGPVQHTIDAIGIHSSSANRNSFLTWSAIVKVTESPKVFLLYPQSNSAMIVAKRSFAKAEEVAHYRDILRKHCADTKGLLR